MGDTPGTGQVLRDLGDLEHWDGDVEGVIGGPGQPSTLLILFRVETAFSLTLRKQRVQPFTDRFLALGLRDSADVIIPIGDDGRPLRFDIVGTPANEGTPRLPAGRYAISIATSQWQQAPFRITLQIDALASLRLSLDGRGELGGRLRATGLRGSFGGEGILSAALARSVALRATLEGQGGVLAGLTAAPTYTSATPIGLPHAWVIDDGTAVRIGAGKGLFWLSATIPQITGYTPSILNVSDYRAGSQRLVFAAGADVVYAANPDIGPTPPDVTTPLSPDYPSLTFHSIIQGAYSREVTFSLPVDGATQVLALLREELRWNNDITRDIQNGAYVATNRARRSGHRRTIQLFVVSGERVRALAQVPEILRARLDVVLPPLNTLMATYSLRVPGDAYPRARVNATVPSFALTGDVPGEGDRIFAADPDEPYGNLLISYGLSVAMQVRRRFTSAAVYDLLQDYTSILGDGDYDRRSYAFAAQGLANLPADLPQYMPWSADGGYSIDQTAAGAYSSALTTRLRYGQWKGSIPASAADQVALSGPNWSLVNLDQPLEPGRLYRGEDLRAFVAYAWDRPAYCRARLGELGFSSGDLLDREITSVRIVLLGGGALSPLAGGASLSGSQLLAIRIQLLDLVLTGEGGLALALSVTPQAGASSLTLWLFPWEPLYLFEPD